MAQRFFCDLCDAQCTENPTRRWERIFGEIGLEIVVLRGATPVGDCNICDECLLKMFWAMLERVPGSELKQKQQGIVVRETACKVKENELTSRELALGLALKALMNKAEEKKVEKVEEKIDEKEDDYEYEDKPQVDELASELDKIKVELNVVKTREKELVRQAEARGFQAAIDKYEYPDYAWKMNKNFVRRGV